MVALLFSAGGAALAVGLIGYQGNSHVQWNKVCNAFDKFCQQVAAAIVVSLCGSAVYLLLVLLAALNLHKKHNQWIIYIYIVRMHGSVLICMVFIFIFFIFWLYWWYVKCEKFVFIYMYQVEIFVHTNNTSFV